MTDQGTLTELREILVVKFDEEELRTLCFDLSVDYDSLPGRGKDGKARELINYLNRRNRIHELAKVGSPQRPDIISWPPVEGPDTDPSISEHIEAEWGFGGPTTERVLGSAEHSVLLVGTSNFRLVPGSDLFPYHDWLNEAPHRIIGLLFLNPHSPHASARERKGVVRSARERIITALKQAHEESRSNPRFIPAVYDGPYRYSARAVDIGYGKKSLKSVVNVISSSHQRGITTGFFTTLDPTKHPDSYSYYRGELLDLWKTALTNPPGHGISIVLNWPAAADIAPQLEQRTRELRAQLARQETDYQLFLPSQFHLTITSLCRTQRKTAAAPLRIGADDQACNLPAHFPEFVTKTAQALIETTDDVLEFDLDQLFLNESGNIALGASGSQNAPSIQVITTFLDTLLAIIDQLSKEFPHEGWNQRLGSEQSYRFRPKSETFSPHVTIGRAFDYHKGLPVPLTGWNQSIRIPPIKLVTSSASIVHYAYRTLLRRVGEIPIELAQPRSLSPMDIVRLLGI